MNVNFEDIKKQVDISKYLERDKQGTGYCCPACASGTGASGTGSKLPATRDYFYCFACGAKFDVFDIVSLQKGCSVQEAVQTVCKDNGINLEMMEARAAFPLAEEKKRIAEDKPQNITADNDTFRSFYAKHTITAELESYLNKRGISRTTAERFNLFGLNAPETVITDKGKENITLKYGNFCVIPFSESSFTARNMDFNAEHNNRYYNNRGEKTMFNLAALKSDKRYVFVVEGAFDALSLIEVGAEALALHGADGKQLVKYLEAHTERKTLLLSLDGDEAGRKATEKLRSELKRIDYPFEIVNVCGAHKDCNEALTADREAFESAVNAAMDKALYPNGALNYLKTKFNSDAARFALGGINTGFSLLDSKSRGLHAGLYALAAVSSLGKTTFAIQIADNIACSGTDVLYFALEQSELELYAKCLSRRIYTRNAERNTELVEEFEVKRGQGGAALEYAKKQFAEEVGNRLNIISSNFNCTWKDIASYTKNHYEKTGNKPVVFVDYLQILPPTETKTGTVREQVDESVKGLERLAKSFKIPVFVISSIGRGGYQSPVDYESFKESGGIEYTADALFGLQYRCLTDKKFLSDGKVNEKRELIKQAKKEQPRKVQFVCLKNRNGISNFEIDFEYYSAYGCFVEVGEAEEKTEIPRKTL